MTNTLYAVKFNDFYVAGHVDNNKLELITPYCRQPEELGRFINANKFWLNKWYGVEEVSTALPDEARKEFSEMNEQEQEKFISEVKKALEGH